MKLRRGRPGTELMRIRRMETAACSVLSPPHAALFHILTSFSSPGLYSSSGILIGFYRVLWAIILSTAFVSPTRTAEGQSTPSSTLVPGSFSRLVKIAGPQVLQAGVRLVGHTVPGEGGDYGSQKTRRNWMRGKIRLDLRVRIDKNTCKARYSIVLLFHYFRIEANRHASKKYRFYSTGCRNSGTFNRSEF